MAITPMPSDQSPKRVRTANPLEKTCLSHLDHEENWKILRHERPTESTELGWKPFAPIFRINFILFSLVLGIAFVAVELGSGSSRAELLSDAPIGSAIVVFISGGMAAYVMALYRTAWNRRAKLWE
jgi:hypothetical protein